MALPPMTDEKIWAMPSASVGEPPAREMMVCSPTSCAVWSICSGVTDPLGGVNTLWPLFGISNQMLAAVALTLCTVVIFKMKRERYAWVTIVPTAWLALCTLTAGLEKVFHPDPSIGFLSHASRYSNALAQGQVLAPAKDVGQMSQIVFNDRIDAALAVLFVLVVVSILYYGIRACLEAYRADRWTAHETPVEPLAAPAQ